MLVNHYQRKLSKAIMPLITYITVLSHGQNYWKYGYFLSTIFQEGVVNFLWTKGNMLNQFLEMIEERNEMIGCDNASREDFYYILKNPEKHRIFDVSLGYIDLIIGAEMERFVESPASDMA